MSRRTRTFLVCLAVCSAVVISAAGMRHSATPTHHHVGTSTGTIDQLPVFADGSKRPDLIPDDVAYRHFLKALAVHEAPSANELARQALFLRRVSLSNADATALLQAMRNVREQLDLIDQDRARADLSSDPAAVAAMATLKAHENDVLQNARGPVFAALSDEGRLAFDRHVKTYIKSRIVIYGASTNN